MRCPSKQRSLPAAVSVATVIVGGRILIALGLLLVPMDAVTVAEAAEVLDADFSEPAPEESLAPWETGSQPPGLSWQPRPSEEGLLCPRLDDGHSLELLSEPLAIAPGHRHRLTIRWRGGLFYQWSVAVRYRLAGEPGREFLYPLFPPREGLAPPPAWETRHLEFIAPSDMAAARIALTVSGSGDRGYRPALRTVQLTDLGREPLLEAMPGPQPPRAVPPALVEQYGGGRNYHRIEHPGRHLVDVTGASVEGAGVILTRVWARGKGSFHLAARIHAPGKSRYFDFASPSWELTDQWRAYHWELPLLFPALPNVAAGIVADVLAEGPVELDEAASHAVESKR